MTPSNDQSRCKRPIWLVLLLVVTGCAHLAPGIAPLPDDPPATVLYGGMEMTDGDVDSSYDDAEFDIDEGDAAQGEETPNLPYQNSDLIPADEEDGARYIARQYPRTYEVPQPPNNFSVPANSPTTVSPGPQPPSVYQLPPGYQTPSGATAGQMPATFQPSQNAAVPLSGVSVAPAQSYPSLSNGNPYQTPGGVLPTPMPLGDFGPIQNSPGAPNYGVPSYGNSMPVVPTDPYAGIPSVPPVYIPDTRTADLEITGYPARTGRLMFGGAVNSDAGVTGQITLDERNFDITRFPRSFQDLASGTAFRGAGQTFRLEAVPGSLFKRYTASFADPNLFGYLPISFGLSAFLFDRRYQDYDEERLGGRISFGYRVTPDLSLSTGLNMQNVEVSNLRRNTVEALNDVEGNNEHYTGEFRLTHDTRDSPFQPSEGHFFEFGYELAFGKFDYSRFEVENRNYLLLAQRADGSGKQTLSFATRLGFSGEDTPLFENYFAGGYSTMRGFDFRGASPVEDTVQVGGRFQWLNALEYMFPITADDAFRGVAFMDFGTVERDIEINKDNFRVAPGLGLRISIPMLGPAPLAFDFAYPISQSDTDDRRIFSFYMSTLR